MLNIKKCGKNGERPRVRGGEMGLGEQSRAPNPEMNHTWYAPKTTPEIAR